MRTFEVIHNNGRSSFVSAKFKKQVVDFFISGKPKKIIIRKDIDPETCFQIAE